MDIPRSLLELAQRKAEEAKMPDHVAVLRRMRDREDFKLTNELHWHDDNQQRANVAAIDHAIATCERHAALVARLGEAPVVEIDSSGDVVTLIAEGSGLDNALLSARIDAMHGQRVRIVPDGGGE